MNRIGGTYVKFLSIQAQDFIEEATSHTTIPRPSFLSIQAQDFIEDSSAGNTGARLFGGIPEHSSSGLH